MRRVAGALAVSALLLTGLLAACSPETQTEGGTSTPAAEENSVPTPGVEAALEFLREREAYMPQFAGGSDGSLYVVWRESGSGRGGNLFVARRADSGAFGPPVRINDVAGSVAGSSLDEDRPAVAVGAGGRIAVAWTSNGFGMRAAVSNDGGDSFAPSVALNSDDGVVAYRGFVDIALDSSGVAHAAWIDGRDAPRGAEEPADLYYARISGGEVTEVNLTEDQTDSICGCCRVDIDVRSDDRLVIAFRNTGGGYRDIHRIEAGGDGTFGSPARLGPPMWEIIGCPVMGPLNVEESTLWLEASTGKRRLLAATATDGSYQVVMEDADEWALERPPRLVIGPTGSGPMILLPGRPSGRILRGSGVTWSLAFEDLPRWAMSAALIDETLVLLGDVNGDVLVETRPTGF